MKDTSIDIMKEVYKYCNERRMSLRGHSDSTITLKELLEFLKIKGVERIILFDLSCSNVLDKDYDNVITSNRSLRFLRKELWRKINARELFYGKSRKKRVIKSNRKSRKSKRRMVM
jgi:hypothetical protein